MPCRRIRSRAKCQRYWHACVLWKASQFPFVDSSSVNSLCSIEGWPTVEVSFENIEINRDGNLVGFLKVRQPPSSKSLARRFDYFPKYLDLAMSVYVNDSVYVGKGNGLNGYVNGEEEYKIIPIEVNLPTQQMIKYGQGTLDIYIGFRKFHELLHVHRQGQTLFVFLRS